MTAEKFLEQLNRTPEAIDFEDTMTVIDQLYDFTPTRFENGGLVNEAGQNSGSCKLFAFAQMHGLDQQQTLNCFGCYYRLDVLQHPESDDHQNIRNFMKTGWHGIQFGASPLTKKL